MLEVLFCIVVGVGAVITAFCTLIAAAFKIFVPMAEAIATFIFKLFGLF